MSTIHTNIIVETEQDMEPADLLDLIQAWYLANGITPIFMQAKPAEFEEESTEDVPALTWSSMLGEAASIVGEIKPGDDRISGKISYPVGVDLLKARPEGLANIVITKDEEAEEGS